MFHAMAHRRTRSGLTIVLFALGICLLLPVQMARAEHEEKKWSGMWINRKYGTKGAVTCTATPSEEKIWQATFEGDGLGKRFTYKVKFQTTKRGNVTILNGSANIDGDAYRWTGYIRDRVFYGKYQSASGNNGVFQMQEPR